MWRGTAATRLPPAKSHEYSYGHTPMLHVYSRGRRGKTKLYNETYVVRKVGEPDGGSC